MEPRKRTTDADLRAIAEKESCPVQRAIAYVDQFLSDVMCGKCWPCALGTYEARVRLNNMVEGRSNAEELTLIRQIAENMQLGSLCKKGRQAATYLSDCLEHHAFAVHAEGRCPDRACKAFFEYRIVADQCTMCGECKRICDHNAILGVEKKGSLDTGFAPFEIRQKRCVKTGGCLDVCPARAIVLVDKPSARSLSENFQVSDFEKRF